MKHIKTSRQVLKANKEAIRDIARTRLFVNSSKDGTVTIYNDDNSCTLSLAQLVELAVYNSDEL